MKVILTESQICYLSLLEEGKILDNLKSKIKKLLLSGMAVASIIATINTLDIGEELKNNLISFVTAENNEPKLSPEEQLRLERRIRACEAYMLYALKNLNYSPESTKLDPEALVKAAYKYNFDLPFLMAAAHLESCFGATPRARRTNSVFSVGSYDNGKNVVTYSHPNQSIEPYIKLLNSDYLINGKTINDLMKHGKFVNKNGHRFASNKKYEQQLRQIRNRIIKKYPELI